ncbi:hypothetical protein COLU111180_06250 [Cohnella lubricantis]|uniref:Phage gp6-like head-tail connector protein n=1 Tax=Cohnella lubricantis TaxID=2163172 RepID=A0A841TE63_9BACL|nr:hypothetical protein [Cohnella lubricantis]MBB6677520.1 hypothetical protein [Cohnella lubricantis]MBP2116594.1 hypothetical protein [Cohnella lubricantis]
MDTTTIVSLVKASLGFTSSVRDTYLTTIAEGVVRELQEEKGLALDGTNPYHLQFVVDYAAWRYKSRDEPGGMPRHLQYRLHNLMVHSGGAAT